MVDEQWREIKEAFQQALDLSPQERIDFLNCELGEKPDVREEVDALLRANDISSDFIRVPILVGIGDLEPDIGMPDPTPPWNADTIKVGEQRTREYVVGSSNSIGAPRWIGEYRLCRKLGEGGMGIVYEAEQKEPVRQVALKIIRGDLYASDFHVKMFEREIKALARLAHPGIVTIYEASRSENGQLFFAMELVRGISLFDFMETRNEADGEPLSIADKLELFSQICEVVSYAHQRGVIHRDLKPQNVMVTDDAGENRSNGSRAESWKIKILDFGLARIADRDGSEVSNVSVIGQIKGTLPYMSPEHVSGDPNEIDVRSDVYSLGVILYEMLTGELPYAVREASLPEALRIIREQRPAPPSRVVSEARTNSGRMSARIDRDLETIILKALEKEPGRRYQSVASILEDIERYLTDQPILARPPSAIYQFRKLVVRHKVAFGSLAALFFLLLGFGIVMVAQSARIAQERDRAVLAEQTADERKNDADTAREKEQNQRLIAEENLRRAEQQKAIAEKEQALAKTARESEQEQRLIAEENLEQANEERIRAETEKASAQKQKLFAQEQKTLAETRHAEAEEQKTLAVNQAEANRRLLYVSQINLAEQAWEQANTPRMEELLEKQIPKPGQADLRGFEWYYLWQLCHRDLTDFRRSDVRSAEFSPDGKLLAVNEKQSTKTPNKIKLLDMTNGREIDTVDGRVFLAFGAEGKILTAVENKESPIESWDVKTKQFQTSNLKTSALFPHIAQYFSLDGKFMVGTELSPTRLEVFDVAKGNKIFSVNDKVMIPVARSLTFSPDSKILATAYMNQVKFRDLNSGKELGVLDSTAGFATIAFSPDGKTLAGKSFDWSVKLWDLDTKQQLADFKGQANLGGTSTYIEFSPNGKILAAANGRAVLLWDVAAKQELVTVKGHDDSIKYFTFSSGGTRLATVSKYGTMKLWNFGDRPELEGQFRESVRMAGQRSADISRDGKSMVTVSFDGKMRLWDFAGNREAAAFDEAESKPNTGLFSPKFSPDGKIVAGKRISTSISLIGVRGGVYGPLELWDVGTGKKIATLEKNVEKFAFAPKNGVLVTVGERMVSLWDLAKREIISTFELTPADERSLAFSPDGSVLAVGFSDTIKLTEISTGRELTPEFSSLDDVSKMEFSADGRILAAADGRNLVLLDVTEKKIMGILKGHTDGINSVSFSPDGRRLVTASNDDTVRIWDIGMQQQLLTIKAKNVHSLIFSSDGRALIGSAINDVQIWRAPTERISP